MNVKASLFLSGVSCLALISFGEYVLAAVTPRKDMAPPLATPPGVTLQAAYYADGQGMTLYTFEKDVKPGTSSCVDDCAKNWPPVLAPADAQETGHWSFAVRPDGAKQWALNGKPVYTFSGDKKVGTANGNGSDGGAWRAVEINLGGIAEVPAGFAVQEVADASGHALVDHRGVSVYMFVGDGAPPESNIWVPLEAAAIANPVGDFSIIKAADGAEHWAYKGKPLYTYSHDVSPGDAKGVNVDARWTVALVERFFVPKNVVVRANPGLGTVLSTTNGATLYMLDGFRYQVGTHNTRAASRGIPETGRSIGTRGCEADCIETRIPFAAPADAQPAGYWTILTRSDGSRQWAYRGYALYTYAGDKAPGDMLGNDIYDLRISHVAHKVVDPSLPISLNWHVAYP